MGELNSILSVNNLSFSYGERIVLKDISLEIKPACFNVILGRNGSGKSTLLQLLAGMLPVQRGTIYLNNKNISALSLRSRAKMLGFLGQKHKAVFPFKVEDVVLTGRAAYIDFVPSSYDKQIVENILEKTGILHLKDRCYTELSGGEQQLVMIARVLAQQAPLLLLDEPTTHLDFYNQEKVLNLLKNLSLQGLCIISVLHDPNLAFLYGDEFIFLKNGEIKQVAPGKNPWDAAFLENIYEMELESISYKNKAIIIPSQSN